MVEVWVINCVGIMGKNLKGKNVYKTKNNLKKIYPKNAEF